MELIIYLLSRYTDADNSLPKVNVTLDDVCLQVRYCQGDMVAKSTTRDSIFMKGAMRRIGVALREKYHWVNLSTPIFLMLDNAGGHGTNQCIGGYVTMLKDEYNVTGPPNTNFTNFT